MQHSIALRDKSFAVFFSHFIIDCFNFKSVFLLKQNGGSGGILPQKMFKFGGFEKLFSALVMRYVSKETSNMKMANNCKSL